jgi:16S rRNA processing protein RimM
MSQRRAPYAQAIAAGSPLHGEPAFVSVGKLRHAHGVHGEILMEVYTDFPERLLPGVDLYLSNDEKPLKLVKCRPHGQGLLLTLSGYSNPEQVGQLRNQVLYVRVDDRPSLLEGEYYHHQLIGLRVTTDSGKTIGSVTEIMETGASDVLVVRPEFGPEVLIPAVDAFIKEINLERSEMIVHLIPGMMVEEA